MNKELLAYYFDSASWSADLLTALIKTQPEWEIKSLYNAFLDVCTFIDSPAGSAALFGDYLKHWVRAGILILEHDKVRAGNTSDGKPLTDSPLGEKLMPFVKEALEFSRQRKARSAELEAIYSKMDQQEITPESALKAMESIDQKYPLAKRKK